MSYNSMADEALQRAKDNIHDAIADLATILVDECSGYGDFSKEYMQVLEDCFTMLRVIKQNLKE